MTRGRTLETHGRGRRAARKRRRTRTSPLQGTSQDQSHPRRRRQNHPSPSPAPVHPHHHPSMSQRVTNQARPVRPLPSPQALPPRRLHPPPSPLSHPARGRALIQLRFPSHPHLLERRRGGSPHCLLPQVAGFPRCERLRLVLRKHLELPRKEERNPQEVGRGQVEEKGVEEVFLTRSRGLRASLSSKLFLVILCSWPLSHIEMVKFNSLCLLCIQILKVK